MIVLWVYLVLFVIGSVLIFVVEWLTPKYERDPVIETLADLVTTLVLLAGMIFMVCGNQDPLMKKICLVAAPLAFLAQVGLSWFGWSKEPVSEKSARMFANILTIFLLVPALIFNLVYSLS